MPPLYEHLSSFYVVDFHCLLPFFLVKYLKCCRRLLLEISNHAPKNVQKEREWNALNIQMMDKHRSEY